MSKQSLDEKLREIRIDWADQDVPLSNEAIAQIKQAFADAHWEPVIVLNRDDSFKATGNTIYKTATLMTSEEWEARAKDKGIMTGQEFYDRFKREYHLRADWISSDETMGDDAEHDVLLCARLAAGLQEAQE